MQCVPSTFRHPDSCPVRGSLGMRPATHAPKKKDFQKTPLPLFLKENSYSTQLLHQHIYTNSDLVHGVHWNFSPAMDASRDLQSHTTSRPSPPMVENLVALSRVPECRAIWVMAFWWVELSSVSSDPSRARLSRPLNLSIAL